MGKTRNKELYNKYQHEYYMSHRKLSTKVSKNYGSKEYNRASNLKAKFGITIEDYENFLKNQKGVCGICQETCKIKLYLCVDHDHKTKKIRGLLCSKCNLALGGFRDDINLLKRAIIWLRKQT